jgi:hypothetical protein
MSPTKEKSTSSLGLESRVSIHLCLICQQPAIIPLQRDHLTQHSCLEHIGDVHNLLRVSKAFFQGFSF